MSAVDTFEKYILASGNTQHILDLQVIRDSLVGREFPMFKLQSNDDRELLSLAGDELPHGTRVQHAYLCVVINGVASFAGYEHKTLVNQIDMLMKTTTRAGDEITATLDMLLYPNRDDMPDFLIPGRGHRVDTDTGKRWFSGMRYLRALWVDKLLA